MRSSRRIFLGGRALVLIALPVALGAGQDLAFRPPGADSPAYEIRASWEVKDGPLLVSGFALNGRPVRDALVLKSGKPVDAVKPLAPGVYEIVLRHAWRSRAGYVIGASAAPESGPPGARRLEWRGQAPAAGGVPEPAEEGFSASFIVEETAGVPRRGEIVYLTVTAPKDDLEGEELAVYDGGRRLPCQAIETRESVPPESQARTHPVTLSRRLAVAVDAAPREIKVLNVFKAAPAPARPDAFVLAGEGLGKTARGARYAVQFHPQSGQIFTIEDFEAGVKLFNKAGVIHWNPDVFIPGIAWDHSFDWKPPRSFVEKNGPLVYLNSRSGPMPRIQETFLEVKYALEAGAPYFVSETRLRVDKDLGVIALRNDEMVLFKELFDTLVYEAPGKPLVRLPLKEIPGRPYGLAHIAPSDLVWVGLLNAKAGYGFFSLRIESSVSNLDPGGAFPHRAGTYFYAPSDGDYVYAVRPWNYTWGDFATANHLTALPAGSLFYEKNAYLIARWTKDTPAALQALARRLRNPLRVF